MTIELELQIASTTSAIPSKNQFEQWVTTTLVNYPHDTELTIRIVDEAESAQLNNAYRHKQGPTNVLSFPFSAPEGIDLPLLGDIVICAPLIKKEAKEQAKSELAHWAHIVIHGTLHLLGYDHIEKQAAEEMESIEIEILQKLEFPNPYKD